MTPKQPSLEICDPTSLRSLLPHTELSVAVSDLCESYPLRSGRANFGARLSLPFISMRRAHRDAPEELDSDRGERH